MLEADTLGIRERRRPPSLAVAALVWLVPLLSGCGTAAPTPTLAAEESPGKNAFEAYCAACHGPEGLGVQGGGPPLLRSTWVSGPEGRLIRIVLHGVRGAIEVGGTTYNLEMPSFGPILTDEQVAAVLTFARRRFGEPSPPVAAEAVRRARIESGDREGYWTAEELLELR
ncbi:MAG: cytochrome c [Planctomycetes bacterium]|nr:cytochrome c [Planctomycetota bacterium]